MKRLGFTVASILAALTIGGCDKAQRCQPPRIEFVDEHLDVADIKHFGHRSVIPQGTYDDVRQVRVRSRRHFDLTVLELNSQPIFQQLSTCYDLLHRLRHRANLMKENDIGTEVEDPFPITDYEWVQGNHDLRRRSGQAAWILEEFLGVDLPKIGPNSGPDEFLKTYHAAEKAVHEFRRERLRDIARAEQPKLADLKRDYHQQVKFWLGEEPTGMSVELFMQVATHSKKLMNELLERWQPIGRPMGELETILGEPAFDLKRDVPNGAVLNYRIDWVWGGTNYTFICKQGIILAVSVENCEPMRRRDDEKQKRAKQP